MHEPPEDYIDKKLAAILARPDMYSTTDGELETLVMTLLEMRHVVMGTWSHDEFQRDYHAFVNEQVPVPTNEVLWLQVQRKERSPSHARITLIRLLSTFAKEQQEKGDALANGNRKGAVLGAATTLMSTAQGAKMEALTDACAVVSVPLATLGRETRALIATFRVHKHTAG